MENSVQVSESQSNILQPFAFWWTRTCHKQGYSANAIRKASLTCDAERGSNAHCQKHYQSARKASKEVQHSDKTQRLRYWEDLCEVRRKNDFVSVCRIAIFYPLDVAQVILRNMTTRITKLTLKLNMDVVCVVWKCSWFWWTLVRWRSFRLCGVSR